MEEHNSGVGYMLFERFFPPRHDKEGMIAYMKHVASYWPMGGVKQEIEWLRLIYRLAHHEEAPTFRQLVASSKRVISLAEWRAAKRESSPDPVTPE